MDNLSPVITPDTQSPEPALSTSSTPPVTPAFKVNHARNFIFGYLALIVLIAAVAGIYSWQHKKVNNLNAQLSSVNKQINSLQKQVTTLKTQTKQNQRTSTTKSASPAVSTTTSTNYFTISQWSVKAPYNGSLTLQYSPDSNPANQMFVSSAQLNAGGPSICTTADGAAGYIGRYLPTDDIPTEGPPGETVQQFIEGGGTKAYAKVGNYYYIYFAGQGNSCGSSTLLAQTQDAFSSLLPTITAY